MNDIIFGRLKMKINIVSIWYADERKYLLIFKYFPIIFLVIHFFFCIDRRSRSEEKTIIKKSFHIQLFSEIHSILAMNNSKRKTVRPIQFISICNQFVSIFVCCCSFCPLFVSTLPHLVIFLFLFILNVSRIRFFFFILE